MVTIIINSIIGLLLYTKKQFFLNFTHIKICFSATVRNSHIHNFTSFVETFKFKVSKKKRERERKNRDERGRRMREGAAFITKLIRDSIVLYLHLLSCFVCL